MDFVPLACEDVQQQAFNFLANVVAEETGLSLASLETSKTGFLASQSIFFVCLIDLILYVPSTIFQL